MSHPTDVRQHAGMSLALHCPTEVTPASVPALCRELRAVSDAAAVRLLAATAVDGGLAARDVWTAIGEHAAVLDAALVRAVVDHVGLESTPTDNWYAVSGLADNVAFRGTVAYPYMRALLDATVAAGEYPGGREWRVLKRLAERGVFTAADHPDAPARLFEVARGPDRAGYAGVIVPALEVLLRIDDLAPAWLAQLEQELDQESFHRLSVAAHPAVTCAVWRQQLLRPTRAAVEFLAGLVPMPAGRTAGGRALAREHSTVGACRCGARRCEAYQSLVALAAASYPRALATLCARARGSEFRRLFRRLAAGSPLEAAGVIKQAERGEEPPHADGTRPSGTLSALAPGDLTPLLADMDAWVREIAIGTLPLVGRPAGR